MKIISLQGSDEIADLMTGTLQNTALAMVNEGIITREVADKFSRSHTACLSPDTSFFRKVMDRIFGGNMGKDEHKVLICKIVNVEPNP